MDANGNIVQQPVYDAIGEFKQYGYAVMQRKGKVGLLNDRGQEIVPPRYEDLKTLDSTLFSVMEKGDWKVVNLEGRTVLQPGYELAKALKAANGKSCLAFMVNKKWGILDGGGRMLAVPKYDEVKVFESAPGELTEFFQTQNDSYLGLLSATGFEILPPLAEDIHMFNDSLFLFKKYQKWGAVNKQGGVVLEAVYDHYAYLTNHFLKLTAESRVSLFSFLHNCLVSNGEYELSYPLSSEYILCSSPGGLGLLDYCGRLVLPLRYDEIQIFAGDLFRVNLNGRWGIIAKGDQVLIPFEYDYIAPIRDGFCLIIQNRRYGLVNDSGKVVVAPQYDRIGFSEHQAKAFLNGRLTTYDFGAEGELLGENSFGKHFTISVRRPGKQNTEWADADNPYLLEKFEWFFSSKKRKWGLRRLDNGEVQIEPSFDAVQVEKELGLTLVGIEAVQELKFDRTTYRFEMAYGLVKNDTGLLVHEVDLLDLRLSDFNKGLPVARCIFNNGLHGLVNRIGKMLVKDCAFIGDFYEGQARYSAKGRVSARLGSRPRSLGSLKDYLNTLLAPVMLADYTQFDLDIDRLGQLYCENCIWGYLDTAARVSVTPAYSFALDFTNEVGIVEREGFWGMVDNTGAELLSCQYDELSFLENTGNKVLRIFKKEEKYGLIDTLGQLAISAQYNDIGLFSDGRLAVKHKNSWGFVDRNGREVIPCRFDEVGIFSEGRAPVRLGSKWGYIDRNGNLELDFQFSKAGAFQNGLAPVKREGPYYGYIDRQGTWVIAPRFPKAGVFDRGVAMVEEMSGPYFRYGLIDRQGNYVAKPKFVSLTPFDRHGLAVAGLGGSPVKYALVNLQGQIITSLAFRSIAPFSEGLARVQKGDGYGFIDTTGRLVIKPDFFKASSFSEGKAAVWLSAGECGFIDKQGHLIVKPEFSRCMDFHEGKAIVYRGSQRAGLIDAQGNLIIEPHINHLLDFSDGRGLVRNERYQFYYITDQARFYDGFYEKASQFRHGVAVVQVQGRWAIINQQGIEIIPPKYDKIEQFENGFAKVRISGFNGLTNLRGELIVQPDYEYLSYAGEGLVRIEQGDKIGYFSIEGNWVWGLQE